MNEILWHTRMFFFATIALKKNFKKKKKYICKKENKTCMSSIFFSFTADGSSSAKACAQITKTIHDQKNSSCDISLYYVIFHYIVWFFIILCDFSLYCVIFFIIWCDISLYDVIYSFIQFLYKCDVTNTGCNLLPGSPLFFFFFSLPIPILTSWVTTGQEVHQYTSLSPRTPALEGILLCCGVQQSQFRSDDRESHMRADSMVQESGSSWEVDWGKEFKRGSSLLTPWVLLAF